MVDIPYVLLHKLLQFKELNITSKSIEDIELQNVLNNTFIPIWVKQQKDGNGQIIPYKNLWENSLFGEDDVEMCSSTDNDGFHGSVEEARKRGYNVSKMKEWTDKGKTGIREWYNNLLKRGVHKQNANNLLVPFAYITCIISGTEWDNFFELRCPKYYSGKSYHKSKKKTIVNI